MAIIVINPYQYAAPIGPSADPYSDYVSLLLHGNGTNGSTTFIDSSSHGHTVTANGNAQISTTQSKFGGASMYFDGNGDYLSLPNDQNSFDFGTGDFTIECWVYWQGGGGNLFSQRHAYNNNNTGMTFRTSTLNKFSFFYGNGLGAFTTSSGSLTQNTWIHVALTRNGNTFTMWVNGQSDGTNTISATMIYYPPVIGRVQGLGVEYFNGYLDDFRITKGVARYTGNFNPPTVELPDPSDPDFSNVSLLLHGNGTNGSTTFRDSSNNSHAITANGDAEISTTENKFGGASMYFDGNGDYLNIPDSDQFEIGSGDFTFEAWIYLTGYSAAYTGQNYIAEIVCKDSLNTGRGFMFQVTGTSTSWTTLQLVLFSSNTSFVSTEATTSFSLNTWYHVAAVRNGTSVRLYKDGIDVGGNTNAVSVQNTQTVVAVGSESPYYISQGYDYYFPGYIDDLRITKGVARYTSNFTPPTAQLPSPVDPYFSDVSLLLHGNGVNNSTTFTDSSSNNHTLTVNGGANISTAQSKFGGASMYFDGSGDSLSLPLDTSIAFGSGEFTFEFWLFRNASSSFVILDTRTPSQNPAGELVILVNSSGRLEIWEQGFTRLAGGSTAVNTWNHYAIARDSSNVVTGYINGTSVDTWSTSLNFVLGSAPRIGSTVNGTFYLNGYIDDLRLTKGVARYTSSFTPPTEPFPND
jgi:hypothetical protein